MKMLREERELRKRCMEEDFFLNPKVRGKLITALVKAVREDAAKVADKYVGCDNDSGDVGSDIAAAIRRKP